MTNALGEASTPLEYGVATDVNVLDDLLERVARTPEKAAFARAERGGWRTVAWARFAGEVGALARNLTAAGIRPGARVAIMSDARYEWVLCDFAIWAAGEVSVPIYETSSAEQAAWILTDSGAVAAFVGDEGTRRLVAPHVRLVWTMDDLSPVRRGPGGHRRRRRQGRGAHRVLLDPAVPATGTRLRPRGPTPRSATAR